MTLLGIDVGTTAVRACAFDAGGRLLADASEPRPPDTTAPGRAEADAEGWWEAARAVCARIGQAIPLAQVQAVGVTGQAPTAVLVDDDGRPLRRAILWLDVRADAEARALATALGPQRTISVGGNRMHAYFLGPKLAWLRAHAPESLDGAAWLLQSHAFLVLRLTGEPSCDPSTAMLCAPLFDASQRAWSDEGARAAGVPRRLLPPLVRSHDVVGAVTRAAAAATGLREGTPVVGGGGDFAAAALGAGVIDEGEACLMLGTAGNLLLPMERPRFDERLINSHHVGCDRWLALGGTLCGGALEWFRAACAPGVAWETLEAEAAAIDPFTSGLIVLPYFQGERTPVWNERARGVFFGLDLTHGRGHLYRALLDGVALGFRDCLAVAEQQGIHFAQVVAANGAGRSALLRQTLCDALGLPLAWAPAGAGTVAGAAILAGLGVGVWKDARAARSQAWGRGQVGGRAGSEGAIVHRPDARAHARLESVFARRAALYELCEQMRAGGASKDGVPT